MHANILKFGVLACIKFVMLVCSCCNYCNFSIDYWCIFVGTIIVILVQPIGVYLLVPLL